MVQDWNYQRELKKRHEEDEQIRENANTLEDIKINNDVLEDESTQAAHQERQRQCDRTMELSNR